MGILKRFKDIMSSNINALLDKAEDPEKMIDQYLRDLQRISERLSQRLQLLWQRSRDARDSLMSVTQRSQRCRHMQRRHL